MSLRNRRNVLCGLQVSADARPLTSMAAPHSNNGRLFCLYRGCGSGNAQTIGAVSRFLVHWAADGGPGGPVYDMRFSASNASDLLHGAVNSSPLASRQGLFPEAFLKPAKPDLLGGRADGNPHYASGPAEELGRHNLSSPAASKLKGSPPHPREPAELAWRDSATGRISFVPILLGNHPNRSQVLSL